MYRITSYQMRVDSFMFSQPYQAGQGHVSTELTLRTRIFRGDHCSPQESCSHAAFLADGWLHVMCVAKTYQEFGATRTACQEQRVSPVLQQTWAKTQHVTVHKNKPGRGLWSSVIRSRTWVWQWWLRAGRRPWWEWRWRGRRGKGWGCCRCGRTFPTRRSHSRSGRF